MPLVDRSVSDSLVRELRGGALQPLLRAVLTDPTGHLDLQLRGRSVNEHGAPVTSTVTIFHGQAKALDVLERGGAFRVRWNPTFVKNSRTTPTVDSRFRRGPALADVVEQAESDLHRLVTSNTRHLKPEGRVHSRLLRFPPVGVVTLDREVMVKPDLPDERRRADMLAVDAQGRLLVIEVKPVAEAVRTGLDQVVHWQVLPYASGLAQAIKATPAPDAVIMGMLRQRHELGLIGAVPVIRTPFVIVPVVAVGSGGPRRLVMPAVQPSRVGTTTVASPELWRGKGRPANWAAAA